MEQWIKGTSVDGSIPVVWLVAGALAALVLILVLTTLPWILYLAERRRNRLLEQLLAKVERRHTDELLEQNKRFGQQLYNQQERSALAMNATVRQLVELWSKAVAGMPDDLG